VSVVSKEDRTILKRNGTAWMGPAEKIDESIARFGVTTDKYDNFF
jgi:hypothetical protein